MITKTRIIMIRFKRNIKIPFNIYISYPYSMVLRYIDDHKPVIPGYQVTTPGLEERLTFKSTSEISQAQ